MKLTQAHVVISGGASGIGYALAHCYLERACSIVILDLRLSEASILELNLAAQKSGGRWFFSETDITQIAQVEAAISAAVEHFGLIDLAINSAGVVLNKTFASTSADEFKRVIDVNLLGSFHFASTVLPRLREGGRLALIASIAGLISNYAYSAYGASKFGVVGLATTLRYEYEHKGIHISCICPPEIKTPMVAAEHLSGNPVSLALKKFGGSMNLDDAVKQIMAGLDCGQWMIIPSLNAKCLAAGARYLPKPFFSLMQQLIKNTENKLT